MALIIRFADLCQQVECHLPIKKLRFKRTHIEQFGGLPCQLGHRFAALGRHREAGGQIDALQVHQAQQRCKHYRQGRSRWTRAADLEWLFQVSQ
ncbi:hypothetical protein D3C80_1391220 [compost metagenome]